MQIMIFGKDKNTIKWVDEQVIESDRIKIGVHVLTTTEAETLLKSMCFDVVLYDVSQPENDTVEIVTELLNICGKIPLIILTEALTLPVAVDAVLLGADTYLVKDKAPKGILAECLNIVIAKKRKQANHIATAKRNKKLIKK